MNHGHYFTGLGTEHRETQNAVAVGLDQRLQEAAVSDIVRDRNKATIGKLPDTSGGALALGLAFAQATRARGGSVNMQ